MNTKTLHDYIALLTSAGMLADVSVRPDQQAIKIQSISHNSLQVKPGALFICKGAAFKPMYLADAVKKGAVCYMAEKRFDCVAEDIPYILVRDMRKAMSAVSAYYFDCVWNEKLKMIGITGTKGKSTTATFVKAIMDEDCKARGEKEIGFLSGIYTYDGAKKVKAKKMTTPETVELHEHLAACVENGCHYLVMETSSQALKYSRTDALHYQVGALLNLSEDHISEREHPNIEDYFASKLLLFRQCETACINLDMEQTYLRRALAEAQRYCRRVITFGQKQAVELDGQSIRPDYYGKAVTSTPGSTTFKLIAADLQKEEEIVVSIGGYYNVSNALAAIAITRALGVPIDRIKTGLAHVKVAGRMELYQMKNKHVDVIVDYAHNKLSYETLFTNVKKLYPGRKILLVFGCHGNKAYNRRKDLGQLANLYADRIVLTEQDPGTEDPAEICRQIRQYLDADKPVTTILDRGEAIAAACEMVEDNWVMVIAGNGADGYQKRGTQYVELPTDGERVQTYIAAHQ